MFSGSWRPGSTMVPPSGKIGSCSGRSSKRGVKRLDIVSPSPQVTAWVVSARCGASTFRPAGACGRSLASLRYAGRGGGERVARIAVLGTLAVDRVVRLDAPLQVGGHQQGVAQEDRCGGGAANAAVALARAGHHVVLVSAVGDDA